MQCMSENGESRRSCYYTVAVIIVFTVYYLCGSVTQRERGK